MSAEPTAARAAISAPEAATTAENASLAAAEAQVAADQAVAGTAPTLPTPTPANDTAPEAAIPPHPAAQIAANAQHIATQAVAGTAQVQPLPEAANEHARISSGILKQAEVELSAYLGAHVNKDLLPELTLTLRPTAEHGHASLHLHFKGPEAEADPLAFNKAVVEVLKHHPAFGPLLSDPKHTPDQHTDACCSADITVPGLSEHQYQSLVNRLAHTPAGTITPLAELPKAPEHPVLPHVDHHAEATPVTAPAHAEHAAHAPHQGAPHANPAPHHEVAAHPATTIANDNAEHQGKLGAQIAASRA